MHSGYEKGYEVVTLKDCTAALSEPMNHDEFLTELSGEKKAQTRTRGDDS